MRRQRVAYVEDTGDSDSDGRLASRPHRSDNGRRTGSCNGGARYYYRSLTASPLRFQRRRQHMQQQHIESDSESCDYFHDNPQPSPIASQNAATLQLPAASNIAIVDGRLAVICPQTHNQPTYFCDVGNLRKTYSEPSQIALDDSRHSSGREMATIFCGIEPRPMHEQTHGFKPACSSKHALCKMRSKNKSRSSSLADDDIWSSAVSIVNHGADRRPFSSRYERGSHTPTQSDFISTDIEELKEAAQSIKALTRSTRDRRRSLDAVPLSAPQRHPPLTTSLSQTQETTGKSSSQSCRRSGISTRVAGHPRGVMQFLPSVRSSDILSRTAYETYMVNRAKKSLANSHEAIDNFGHSSFPLSSASASHATVPVTELRRKSVPDTRLSPMRPTASQCSSTLSTKYDGGVEQLSASSRLAASYSSSGFDSGIISGHASGSQDSLELETRMSMQQFSEQQQQQQQQPLQHFRQSSLELSDRRVSRTSSFAPPSSLSGQPRKLLHQLSQCEKQSPSDVENLDLESSFNRFGKLLRSLQKSRQGTPEGEVDDTGADTETSQLSSPTVCSDYGFSVTVPSSSRSIYCRPEHRAPAAFSDNETSLTQADLLLWRRRSRGSLRKHEDTRLHIVKEMCETESSYIESLRLLVNKYLRPLKRPELCALVEPAVVDEIFFQVPDILGHHELFHATLKSRLDCWDNRQKIGDVMLHYFTKQAVIDTYMAFVNNWKNAKLAIRNACQAKAAFAKYLESCSREHKHKLSLDALLIMPIQRIPRYELLIKEFLKHTSVEHPDYPLLLRAQKEIHALATKINHAEAEAGLAWQMMQRLREIEAIVEGLDDLVHESRMFLRYDFVSVEIQSLSKERCLFLFSDQLIITSVKRKNSTTLKKSQLHNRWGQEFLETHKFKLLMRISLNDIHITKNSLPMLTRLQDEVSELQEDSRILSKASELLALLKVDHDVATKEIEDLKISVKLRIAERQRELSTNPALTSIELLVTTEEGIEALLVSFPSADKRVAWEKCFSDTKDTLELSLARRPPPIYVCSIPLQRSRSGLTFTCAAPTLGRNELGYPNVWICNTDGFIGQICVLKLTPEPQFEPCNALLGSRILCICAMPEFETCSKRGSKKRVKHGSKTASSNLLSVPSSDSGSAVALKLESDSSENESTSNYSRSSRESIERDLTESEGNAERDQSRPTMWVGTEDGCVHIYKFNDDLQVSSLNKSNLQHSAAVQALLYADGQVFVALRSGIIQVYQRDTDGKLNLSRWKTVSLPPKTEVASMCLVINRIWCCSFNRILILNPSTLVLEASFTVCSDVDSVVGQLSTCGLGVWISVQGSPVIKLYHAATYECLFETNVSPTVTKTLAGCDDIIRAHKLACLRVTALLACKDLLWIGTSAGVILQLALPHVTPTTSKLTSTPTITCISIGHCGPCRFICNVELQPLTRSGSHLGMASGNHHDLSRRRMSLNLSILQQGKVYIVSGGDGLEDFQDADAGDLDDTRGRTDSINHLLLWQA